MTLGGSEASRRHVKLVVLSSLQARQLRVIWVGIALFALRPLALRLVHPGRRLLERSRLGGGGCRSAANRRRPPRASRNCAQGDGGQEPGQQIQEDLRHFKQMMEAGEIPTTEGQPTGRCRA